MSRVTDELPEGWCVSTIDELCELNPKHDSSLKANLPVSFVPMAAVSEVEGQITTPEVRPLGEVKKGYTHFADGDVILAKITPCMENGKAASVRGMVNGLACGTTEFFVFRSRGAIDQDYLFKFIRQESFRRAARATMQSGVGQARVPKEFVLETEIPLAPLSEQRRIVAKIEALQARSRKAREALEAIPPLLEQFRQSVLAAAFRGDLTADWREQHPDVEPAGVLLERIRAERRRKWEQVELAKFKAKGKVPKDDSWKEKYVEPEPVDDTDLPELPEGWRWVALDELVDVQLGQRRAPEFAKLKKFPYIRSANITWQGLDVTDVKTMGFADPDSLQMQSGDILLNEASGSPTEVGKPVLWRCEIPICCFQATVLRLRSRSQKVCPEWLYFHCLKDAILGEYAARTPGIGIIHLTAKLLRTWPIPLAPIEEQSEVVARLETAIKAVRNSEYSIEQSRSEVNQLDQSILAKAFRGELVPQDPDDEPASVLLERIQAERAEDTNGKPARGRRKQMQ